MKRTLLTILAVLITRSPDVHADDSKPWTCQRIETPPGPEDFELDQSSAPSRLVVASHPPVAIPIEGGALKTAQPFRIDHLDTDFYPIGISLVSADNNTLLYVINKGVGIEVFKVQGSDLHHVRTLRDRLISNPNEVLATIDGQVYVSNISAHGGLRGLLSTLFRTRSGNVVHFDGRTWSVASGPIGFGNGMLLSPDGTRFWVAGFSDRRLYRFDRDPHSGALTYRNAIVTHGHPDNLQWSQYPLMTVATHPSYIRAGLHVQFPKINSPSQVEDVDTAIESSSIIFSDDGSRISAASTAIVYGSHLFISQIRRGYVLDCQRKQ